MESPESLFNNNTKLIYKFVNSPKYLNSVVTGKDDMMQEGMIGLWNAALNFNPKKKIKFSTFASNCIKNRLYNYYDRKTDHYRNLPGNHISIHHSIGNFKEEFDSNSNQLLDYLIIKNKISSSDKMQQIKDIYRVLLLLYKDVELAIMIDWAIKGKNTNELYRDYSQHARFNKITRYRFWVYLKKIIYKIKKYYVQERINKI